MQKRGLNDVTYFVSTSGASESQIAGAARGVVPAVETPKKVKGTK